MPNVVTSAIDPRCFDEARTAYSGSALSDIPTAQPWAVPAWAWISDTLHDFVAVRNELLRCKHPTIVCCAMIPPNGSGCFCLLPAPYLQASQWVASSLWLPRWALGEAAGVTKHRTWISLMCRRRMTTKPGARFA